MEDLPELVRLVYHLFGETWAKRFAWIIVILIVFGLGTGAVVGLREAIDSVDDILGSIKQNSYAWNTLITFIGVIISIGFMFAMALVIGTLLGWTLRICFMQPNRRMIDGILNRTVVLLENSNSEGLQDAKIEQLLQDARVIQEDWNESKINKFLKWLYKKPDKKKVNQNDK